MSWRYASYLNAFLFVDKSRNYTKVARHWSWRETQLNKHQMSSSTQTSLQIKKQVTVQCLTEQWTLDLQTDVYVSQVILKTRMHYSRMRTVRCSSRLLGAEGCLPRRGVHQGGVCPGSVYPSACWDTTPPPPTVNGMTDRYLWKYYLAGNKS